MGSKSYSICLLIWDKQSSLFACGLQEEDLEMRMNFERRKTGLERKIKQLSESLAKEKKTRAGMKESELFIFVLDFNPKQK